MGNDTDPQEILVVLREIRDAQREMLRVLSEQRTAAEDQLRKSRASVEESIGLQRAALQRQRTVTVLAVPGIIACIAAIAYLVIRYF